MQAILFVFTKHYPFGTAEQYIADEQEYLAEAFAKIVFVPCEVFGEKQMQHVRPIPANADILLLNQEAAVAPRGKRRWRELAAVFFGEWKTARNKTWFWKERKRYLSVLVHQSRCADVLTRLLDTKYAGMRHCFYTYWIHNSTIMLGLMKRRGTIRDFVSRGHSIDLYDWDWTSTRTAGLKVLPFHNFNIASTPFICPISLHGERFLKNKFPQYAHKIKAFRLGVHDCGNNPYDPSAVFTIVSCGGVTFSKGIHRIPGVLELLDFPVRWVHFGSDGNATELVQAAIKKLGPGREAVLRGYTPNAEIKTFYATQPVNLFISLSEVEGIPVSIMEAISFGIPVLATEVYGTPEVANSETGFCVPYESNPETIAALIRGLHNDPVRQQALRKQAKVFFRNNFYAPDNYRSFASGLLRHLDRNE